MVFLGYFTTRGATIHKIVMAIGYAILAIGMAGAQGFYLASRYKLKFTSANTPASWIPSYTTHQTLWYQSERFNIWWWILASGDVSCVNWWIIWGLCFRGAKRRLNTYIFAVLGGIMFFTNVIRFGILATVYGTSCAQNIHCIDPANPTVLTAKNREFFVLMITEGAMVFGGLLLLIDMVVGYWLMFRKNGILDSEIENHAIPTHLRDDNRQKSAGTDLTILYPSFYEQADAVIMDLVVLDIVGIMFYVVGAFQLSHMDTFVWTDENLPASALQYLSGKNIIWWQHAYNGFFWWIFYPTWMLSLSWIISILLVGIGNRHPYTYAAVLCIYLAMGGLLICRAGFLVFAYVFNSGFTFAASTISPYLAANRNLDLFWLALGDCALVVLAIVTFVLVSNIRWPIEQTGQREEKNGQVMVSGNLNFPADPVRTRTYKIQLPRFIASM
jgi:hypothetical protein